ncbi:MAG: DEAD/DEAH box helicase [Fibrobacterota bacterium]
MPKSFVKKTIAAIRRLLPSLAQAQPAVPTPAVPAPAAKRVTRALPAQRSVTRKMPKIAPGRETAKSAEMPPSLFYGLGIAPGLLEVVDKLHFHTPTPIQHKTIPMAIEGNDVVGIAQTGTGKTLAFGIPLIQRLAAQKGKALILAPTRELAIQIEEALHPFARAFTLHTAVLIGGASMSNQISALRRNPRILIATPGRLIDLMEQGEVRLEDAHILVLDEADRMLDMGFMPQIQRILRKVPRERQTLLFSATMPPDIVKIASAHMHLPVRTEIAPSGTAPESVTQEIFVVRNEHKPLLLQKLLQEYGGSVLLFTRTRRGAARVTTVLHKAGHNVAEIHSDRSLGQRREALEGFKAGKYRILVATDIAARGIDVTGIELVLNYDLPDDPENYVHRIGRTGRAGREGHAISLATPAQGDEVRNIERIIRTSIEVSAHPEIPVAEFSAMARLHPAIQSALTAVSLAVRPKPVTPKPETDWGRQPHAGRKRR